MNQVIHAKLEDWSKSYDGPKFHAVLCDPPYDLGFMGESWDTNAQFKEWGEAILPLLYPGAIVMMFGGTRKWHRLAVGMEDAGFEIWDTMMWLYGQGFPKAQDISKLIDKANGDEREVISPNPCNRPNGDAANTKYSNGNGSSHSEFITAAGSSVSAPWSGHKTTALKPAWEPVLCFKKPLDGTYAECAIEYGSGALNVDGGRIAAPEGLTSGGRFNNAAMKGECYGKYGEHVTGTGRAAESPLGRYPANLLLDEESAVLLDEQSGELHLRGNTRETNCGGGMYGHGGFRGIGFSESGFSGASRFFYCSKASTSERNAGVDDRNIHPTVKQINLARYLAKLLLPPDSVKPRRLLVPFAGSGSEMIGALLAGWDEVVGIEKTAEYVPIAEARLNHWTQPDQMTI